MQKEDLIKSIVETVKSIADQSEQVMVNFIRPIPLTLKDNQDEIVGYFEGVSVQEGEVYNLFCDYPDAVVFDFTVDKVDTLKGITGASDEDLCLALKRVEEALKKENYLFKDYRWQCFTEKYYL